MAAQSVPALGNGEGRHPHGTQDNGQFLCPFTNLGCTPTLGWARFLMHLLVHAVLEVWSQRVPEPGASAAPGNWLEMQISPAPSPKTIELAPLDGAQQCFNKPVCQGILMHAQV